MFVSKKFSKVFYSLEDAINTAYFGDHYLIIEYKDKIDNYKTTRATRTGLICNDMVIWDPWEDPYDNMEAVKSVYRVRIDCKLDNAYQGIV